MSEPGEPTSQPEKLDEGEKTNYQDWYEKWLDEHSKIDPEKIKETKEWIKKTIENWHDKVHPDYVFVTETTAIPYGYVLKEAWKRAFPEEECPKFYRIDPRGIEYAYTRIKKSQADKAAEGIKKYFMRRIKKSGARIIVYDEYSYKYDEDGEPLSPAIKNYEMRYGPNGMIYDSLPLAAREIQKQSELISKEPKEVWMAWGRPKRGTGISGRMAWPYNFNTVPYHSSQSPTSKFFSIDKRPNRPYSDDELLLLNQSSSDDLDRLIEEGNFTLAGRIVKHPEQRKRAIDFVKRLKKLGREAGEELGDELEKRKEEQDNN